MKKDKPINLKTNYNKYHQASYFFEKMIKNCKCGLTSGCDICNPMITFQLKGSTVRFGLRAADWGAQKKRELKKWKKRLNYDFEKKRIEIRK